MDSSDFEKLSEEYISLVDHHGPNSTEAKAFRNRHAGNSELKGLFDALGELESAGRAARFSRAVSIGCWAGTAMCVVVLGWVGFNRGVDLARTQGLLANATTQLALAETENENLKTQWAIAQQGRDKAIAEMAAVKKGAAAVDQVVAKLNETKHNLDATKVQLAAAEAAVKSGGAKMETARSAIAALQAKVDSSEKLRNEANHSAATARQELAAVLGMEWRPEPLSPVSNLAFSIDGRLIAAADRNGELEVFDVHSGKTVTTDHALTHAHIVCVGFPRRDDSHAMVVATSQGGALNTWALGAGGEMAPPIKGPWGPIFSAAFSPDGEVLALGAGNKTVYLVDRAKGKVIRPLTLRAGSPAAAPAAASHRGTSSAVDGSKK